MKLALGLVFFLMSALHPLSAADPTQVRLENQPTQTTNISRRSCLFKILYFGGMSITGASIITLELVTKEWRQPVQASWIQYANNGHALESWATTVIHGIVARELPLEIDPTRRKEMANSDLAGAMGYREPEFFGEDLALLQFALLQTIRGRMRNWVGNRRVPVHIKINKSYWLRAMLDLRVERNERGELETYLDEPSVALIYHPFSPKTERSHIVVNLVDR